MTGCSGECQQRGEDCPRQCPLFEVPPAKRRNADRWIIAAVGIAMFAVWAFIGWMQGGRS